MFTDSVAPVSSQITGHEDNCIANFLKEKQAADKRASEGKQIPSDVPSGTVLAHRPGYGTLGRSFILRSNMFLFDFKPGLELFSYRLKFNPPDITRGQQKFVIRNMLRTYRPFVDHQSQLATDTATEIVTTQPLPDNRQVHRVTMANGENRNRSGWTVTVAFMESYRVDKVIGNLRDVRLRKVVPNKDRTDAEGSDVTRAETSVVRMLNILMSNYPNNTDGTAVVGKGRNKVFKIDQAKQFVNIGCGIEAVRGYYSSVRLATGNIMLNLNISHSAMYRPGKLISLIDEFARTVGEKRGDIGPFLARLIVSVSHIPARDDGSGNMVPVTRTIWGVATPQDGTPRRGQPPNPHPPRVARLASSADNVSFWREDRDGNGDYITVTEYFRQGELYAVVNMETLGANISK